MSTTNAQWVERSLRAVWHPCTQMKTQASAPMLPIVAGEGAWLIDSEGGRYLDMVSSWWVNLFGHREPRITAAIRAQLDRIEHVMLAGFTHEPVVQLSEQLAALTQNALGHCFYASDGASATEIALKMSAHYWRNCGRTKKNRFVAVQGGYHGETIGALGVTDVAIFRAAYESLLRAATLVPSPDARGTLDGETSVQCAERAAAALETVLTERAQEISAIIVEPLIQCASGMAMHDVHYLKRVRALCDRFDVHFIADEIAVGFGRSGTFFAHEQAGVRPDFLCLSKGITGGYLPLSVVLTSDKVYDAFYDDSVDRGFLHSHSYTGNPLACSAALAVLKIFDDDKVIERNRAKAQRFQTIIESLREIDRVENLRHQGMIWAFDVRTAVATTAAPAQFAKQFAEGAMRESVLLRPIGNTVYFLPPYVTTEEEFGMAVDVTRRTLLKTLRQR